LFFLSFKKGSGKGFYAHNQVCLDIYTLFGFFGGALKVPVLFNLSKEFIGSSLFQVGKP